MELSEKSLSELKLKDYKTLKAQTYTDNFQ
jgi:hypothetical protein